MKSTSRPMSTDKIMKNLWSCLANDFRATNGQDYAVKQEINLAISVERYRTEGHPFRSQAPVYLFKQEYQLESLFKRYRFEHDMFTDQELDTLSIEKFLATQDRLGTGPLHVSNSTKMVLRRARLIARSILGEYNTEEHVESCRFGRRACVGTPYVDSYLHRKMDTVTGSKAHIEWFERNILPVDNILAGLWAKTTPEVCVQLAMTLVPKSFKGRRSIFPDTLLGSFYTAGIGKMMEKRLRRHGLNIKTLQERHKMLAQRYSVSRSHVTADLTAASDSITVDLLRRVLPRDWYFALLRGRISGVVLPTGGITHMNTVLTMGLGHTFPLQTLLFYCLTKALGELLNVRGVYSVYGDDLIYPKPIHRYAVKVLSECKLLINTEKTYAEDNFRESCGGDYYHGVDVRPFSPEGTFTSLSGKSLEVWLYKLHNGLTRRWDKEEIPLSLQYLEGLLLQQGEPVCCVPKCYPDGSGLINPYGFQALFKRTKKGYTFPCLREVPSHVRVNRGSQEIYLWEKLRTMELGPEELNPYEDPNDNPILKWELERYRGRKERRLLAYLSSKSETALQRQVGSVPWL